MNIDEQIQAKREELAKLEKLKEREANLTIEQRLAEALHGSLCHWNHTDGCSWSYGSWDEPSHAHVDYLGMARRVMKVEPNVNRVIEILGVIKA